jgi:trans-aconitate methyltransferase
METRAAHWQQVYATKAADAVSWFQDEPRPSLDAIDRAGLGPETAFIDVGGGASRLVDALIARGWRDLTVLDISAAALAVSKSRLGPAADMATWIAADITAWRPQRSFDLWHDRAVFHFLTEAKDRDAYLAALQAGLRRGGQLIMATFAPDGPERCSGLPVQRYDETTLGRALGEGYELAESWRERHATPWGAEQAFNWCRFVRTG